MIDKIKSNIFRPSRTLVLHNLISIFVLLSPEVLILSFLFMQPIFEFSNTDELNIIRHIIWRLLIVALFLFTLYDAVFSSNSVVILPSIKYPLFIYVLTAFISTVVAYINSEMDLIQVLYALTTIILLLLFIYVIPYWFMSIEKILRAINVYILSLVITNLYGIVEFIVNRLLLDDITFRMSSFFNDPNIYARFDLIGIFFLLSFLFFRKDLKVFQKNIYLFILLLSLIGLLFSLSRSGLFTFFLVTIIFSLLIKNNKFKIMIFVAILFFTLIAVILLITERDFFGGSVLVEASNLNRVQLILGGINIIKENWILGIGYTNFGNYYISHYVSNILKVSAYDYNITGLASSIHNWFIEVWAEQGILGVISFIIFFFNSLRILFRKFKLTINWNLKACLLAFFMMILIFLVHGFFYHTFIFHFFFWLMFGFVITISLLSEQSVYYQKK